MDSSLVKSVLAAAMSDEVQAGCLSAHRYVVMTMAGLDRIPLIIEQKRSKIIAWSLFLIALTVCLPEVVFYMIFVGGMVLLTHKLSAVNVCFKLCRCGAKYIRILYRRHAYGRLLRANAKLLGLQAQTDISKR
eukprot:GHVQ01028092.1.p1 GENE.GHVQ01028092.1~~GHVQ01028092.1.p1  ORF type:complete len:144 (+),score=8.90 GHVQ01028092.1:35-433(+)